MGKPSVENRVAGASADAVVGSGRRTGWSQEASVEEERVKAASKRTGLH